MRNKIVVLVQGYALLLATEYFCFGGSFVYYMKTSNVGISFDQHDWHYEAKIFMKSFFNFHTVTKNHKMRKVRFEIENLFMF